MGDASSVPWRRTGPPNRSLVTYSERQNAGPHIDAR